MLRDTVRGMLSWGPSLLLGGKVAVVVGCRPEPISGGWGAVGGGLFGSLGSGLSLLLHHPTDFTKHSSKAQLLRISREQPWSIKHQVKFS